MLEDARLIWKFNRGEREVLHEIYEKYKYELVTLAAGVLCDKCAAEDVVQDVFVGLAKRARKLKVTQNLKGYLLTAVANRARTANKVSARHQIMDVAEGAEQASKARGPEPAAIFGEQSQLLAAALAELAFEQREAVMLRALGEMRFRKIADLQGVSASTVRGRYRYGIEKLRSILDGEMAK